MSLDITNGAQGVVEGIICHLDEITASDNHQTNGSRTVHCPNRTCHENFSD